MNGQGSKRFQLRPIPDFSTRTFKLQIIIPTDTTVHRTMFLDVATSTTPSPAPFPGHRLRVLSETIVNGGATLVFELENPGAGDENAAPRELRYVTDFSANGYAGD